MTDANDKNTASTYGDSDRRVHGGLRDIFERAYAVAFPLLDPEQNLQGARSAHFLRVVLHDAFPDLHPQDVAILSVSIERVFRERSRPASK